MLHNRHSIELFCKRVLFQDQKEKSFYPKEIKYSSYIKALYSKEK